MEIKILNLTRILKRIVIPVIIMLLIAGATYASSPANTTDLSPSSSIHIVTNQVRISGKLILSIALFLYLLSQKSNEKNSVKEEKIPSNSVSAK